MADEDSLSKYPTLELAQLAFLAKNQDVSDAERAAALDRLQQEVSLNNMAPFAAYLAQQHEIIVPDALVAQMKTANALEFEKLDAAIKDATENLGETEIRDAYVAKAEYQCRIGDKAAAERALREAFEKTVPLGQRMDVVFNLIRLGFFFGDQDIISRNIAKATSLLEEGGDWDRRNRLKVYRAVDALSRRDFRTAAGLFLETVSTFTSYELMDYKEFVTLTVLTAMISLPRPTLKEKVVSGPEIQEVLHGLPLIKTYLISLYTSDYRTFFQTLAEVEGIIARHRMFAPHRRFYVREMRILAYSQLLESYRSVTLVSLAASFGVSVEYIDHELSRFIAAGRLNCKIDKVGGVVETNRPDRKNAQYQAALKQGDLLLNRLQKLSQVINA